MAYLRNKSDCEVVHIIRWYNIGIIKIMLFISGKTKNNLREAIGVMRLCMKAKNSLEK